jgi:hypothetical protein
VAPETFAGQIGAEGNFRVADNTPRTSYFALRNNDSGKREHLSGYATNRASASYRTLAREWKEYVWLVSCSYTVPLISKTT